MSPAVPPGQPVAVTPDEPVAVPSEQPVAAPSDGLRVRIVGTGLIGTSLGMALSRKGFQVSLEDPSPTAAALARDLGAGALAADTTWAPDVVVVAAPPDVVAAVVARELSAWPDAVVTDAASVKGAVLSALQVVFGGTGGTGGSRRVGADLARYVGSHPMTGREKSGAVSAQVDPAGMSLSPPTHYLCRTGL